MKRICRLLWAVTFLGRNRGANDRLTMEKDDLENQSQLVLPES